MINDDWEDFEECLRAPGFQDFEFNYHNIHYALNVDDTYMYISRVDENGNITGEKLCVEPPEDLIDVFLTKPYFEGKTLKEIEAEVYITFSSIRFCEITAKIVHHDGQS